MKKIFVVCPHHGEPIYKVGINQIKIFRKTFTFYNLVCGRREFCDVDVSNDPNLLSLLDRKIPLSQDEFLSKRHEPNLEKAGERTYDYCPYCGKEGGMSYVYAYLPGFMFPKTFQRYKMDCGHDFAIIYNIS
jgi:hypothetical protein